MNFYKMDIKKSKAAYSIHQLYPWISVDNDSIVRIFLLKNEYDKMVAVILLEIFHSV